MDERFSRTELLYGRDRMRRLSSCRVCVFGVGGVGGYVVEALARSGIGALDLVDSDKVCLSNINRQILATEKTVGRYKVDVAKERVLDINPDCNVRVYRIFYLPDTQDQFDFRQYDYVVDAIDTVTGKLAIIENASKAGVRVISSMGAGNKINPSAFEVADLYETSVCPLAKVMRRECRKRGIDSLKVVYSKEKPLRPVMREGDTNVMSDNGADSAEEQSSGAFVSEEQSSGALVSEEQSSGAGGADNTARRRSTPGSTAFAPSVAGLIIAGEVINDLTGMWNREADLSTQEQRGLST